jgi:uncharacterized protein (TIGR02246 family)
MGSDEQAIRKSHSTWIDAVNAGDLDRLLSMMTDDIIFLSPGESPTARDDFPPKFTSAHQRLLINCVSELEEVVVAGDVAYTRSRDSLSLRSRGGGDATQLGGYRMTVYRRQADGRWLLARDVHTLTVVES